MTLKQMSATEIHQAEMFRSSLSEERCLTGGSPHLGPGGWGNSTRRSKKENETATNLSGGFQTLMTSMKTFGI